MTTDTQFDTIVVGAGMAGLGAARALQQRGYSVLVLESESTPGGRARTDPWGDARVELGAWYVAPVYRRVMQLIDELGMSNEIISAAPGFPFAIRHGERWRYVNFLQPLSLITAFRAADIPSLLRLPGNLALPVLKSLIGRRRLTAADVSHAADFDKLDASDLLGPIGEIVDAFGRLYIGYAVTDMGGPFFASLFSGAARGMLGLGPTFQPMYLRDGTGSLTAAMAAELPVLTGMRVTEVTHTGDGVTVTATDSGGDEHTFSAATAILATTADITAAIWGSARIEQRAFLASVRYTEIALLYLRLRNPYLHLSPRGERVGEIVPESQRQGKFTSGGLDMDWAASTGGVYVTGESVSDRRLGLSLRGEPLADRLTAQTYALHPELRGQVVGRRLVEINRCVPVFESGYVSRLIRFRQTLGAGPVDVAGDYLHSPILEGAYTSGLAAAERTAARLDSTSRIRLVNR